MPSDLDASHADTARAPLDQQHFALAKARQPDQIVPSGEEHFWK
jgi:hypothetical protein